MKTTRKECRCNFCESCGGQGRKWDEIKAEYKSCEDCEGRGSRSLCFTHAKLAKWLDVEDIARHDRYIRKQAA